VRRRRTQPLRNRVRKLVDVWVDLLARHEILTFASAIAFRTLVALIPLLLLGLAILGAIHRPDVWRDELSPGVAGKVRLPVFAGIDDTVEQILTHGTAPLIAFAGALSIWDVSSSVRACMGGMNAVYEDDERRSTWRRLGVSVGLGIGIAACVIGAVLIVIVARSWGGYGFAVVRWLGAIVLVGLAVGLLFRFAPTKPRATRWESAGTVLVVVAWIVASLVFKWFVTSVANFRTATGILAAFLVLTTYVYVSSIVFLVGVQLDELFRADAATGERGILDLIRRG
jgi:membrane protein